MEREGKWAQVSLLEWELAPVSGPVLARVQVLGWALFPQLVLVWAPQALRILNFGFRVQVLLDWVELKMKWGKVVLDRGAESPGQSFRRALKGVSYGTGRMEDPKKEGVQDEYRKRSERYAGRGVRGGSLADVRSIGEVEAGTRGADSLQGAENGFIGERGVGPKRDHELGVACFSLGEK